MKNIVFLLCVGTMTLAEPPVGDGYPGTHSHDQLHDHDDHPSFGQRSPSQKYRPPSNALFGYDSNSANPRKQPRIPPAAVRVSFNHRFGSSSARNSIRGSLVKSQSQEYAAPNARNGISQQYGPPAKPLSQEYGTPSVVAARTVSSEYGAPSARSSPSEEYNAPAIASRSNQKPYLRAVDSGSAQPLRAASHDYSSPAARSQFQPDAHSHSYLDSSVRSNDLTDGYNAPPPVFGARSALSSSYGIPSRSPSGSYNAPSARNSGSDYNSVSPTYGAPSQRDLSDTYTAPSARALSQEYGAPSSRTNLKDDVEVSSSASFRSAPSSTYLPSARDAMPSQQYGVPEKNNHGYDEARTRALDELLNQEPANYDFAYQIEDVESGSDFGHTETRQDNRAEGSYFVLLPDGTKQTVQYSADERGFQPRISVERAAGGYQEDAAGVSTSQGPY